MTYYRNRARFSAPATISPLGYSDRQASYLTSLVDTVQMSLTDLPETDTLFTTVVDALVPHLPVVDAVKAGQPADKALVSSAIDALVKIKTTVTTVRAPQVAAQGAPAVRSNAHPGKCADCGESVAAQAGALTGRPGAWEVRHLPGACPVAAPAPEVPLGLHYIDGRVVEVYLTKYGRHAGKVLIGSSFRYEKGAILGLSEATLMTAEQAAQYGRTTGHCCACGLEIGAGKTESTLVSLAQGYGPVCAKNNGWPSLTVTAAKASLRAAGISHPLLVDTSNECAGGTCGPVGTWTCSKHNAESQRLGRRAENE